LNTAILISIVDDDPFVRESTVDLVNSLGFAAAAFESAEAFLVSGRVKDTSCLITDLQLTGLSGVELQERLQRGGHGPPIIFITAFPEARVRARAMAAGAVAFLTKPFEETALINSLSVALNREGL
jgi:FixJ family two-component response regulator